MFTAWIGTYTHLGGAATGSGGIYRITVDASIFGAPRLAAEAVNPSYLCLTADGRRMFASHEVHEGQGTQVGCVASYAIEGEALTPINLQPTGGRAPCHVIEHEGWVVAANYGDGTASIHRHEDGVLGARSALVVHGGTGPNPDRQEGPHAHFAAISPQRELCVVDLGLDRIMRYRYGDWGFLGFAAALPGAGPRHMTFVGDRAYVLTELGNTVEEFTISGSRWERVQSISTLPDGFSGTSHCAAIRATRDGRFILASNRGHDSIAVFRRGEKLELAGIYPCGGREPRDFALSPDGSLVVCGLQHDHRLALLAFDQKTGKIADTQMRAEIPAPVCVVFS